MHTLKTTEVEELSLSIVMLRLDRSLREAERQHVTEWLSEAERARLHRMPAEVTRDEFLATRLVARSLLAKRVGAPPRELRFVENEHGRPSLANDSSSAIAFNLSNTRGLIACVLSDEVESGIDVEWMDRKGETVRVANRFFAPSETEELLSLEESAQRSRFFDYWTLKEAYIKAKGKGLAIPLRQFAFRFESARGDEALDRNELIRVHFADELEDIPSEWTFRKWTEGSHRIAWASRHRARSVKEFVRAASIEELLDL